MGEGTQRRQAITVTPDAPMPHQIPAWAYVAASLGILTGGGITGWTIKPPAVDAKELVSAVNEAKAAAAADTRTEAARVEKDVLRDLEAHKNESAIVHDQIAKSLQTIERKVDDIGKAVHEMELAAAARDGKVRRDK